MPEPPVKPKIPQGGKPGTSSLFSTAGPVSLGTPKGNLNQLGNTGSVPAPRPGPMVTADLGKPEDTIKIPEYRAPVMPAVVEMPFVQETAVPEAPDRQDRWRSAPSPSTSWSTTMYQPRIDPTSYTHPLSSVTGNVYIGRSVFIAGGVLIRAENEEPIYIGDESNIQEAVVLRDLPTHQNGEAVKQRIVEVGSDKFSLYIGNRVSIAPQAQIHGPAYIGDGVFVGMQSLVFWARIEPGVVIEPDALVMNVTIPTGVFVPAGLKVTTQRMVRDLPPLTQKYRFHGIGEEMVACSLEILRGYKSLGK